MKDVTGERWKVKNGNTVEKSKRRNCCTANWNYRVHIVSDWWTSYTSPSIDCSWYSRDTLTEKRYVLGGSIFVELMFVIEGRLRWYVTKPIRIQPIRMSIIFHRYKQPVRLSKEINREWVCVLIKLTRLALGNYSLANMSTKIMIYVVYQLWNSKQWITKAFQFLQLITYCGRS